MNELKNQEALMKKDNALSMIKKLLIGIIVILTVGISAYLLLLALLLSL